MVPPIFLGLGNIFFLRGLVAAKKEQDKPVAVNSEIDAISWAVINAQLTHPFTNGSIVTQIAEPDTVKTYPNLRATGNILEPVKPFLERLLAGLSREIIDFVRICLH